MTRPSRTGTWDRFTASDPGLLRLMAGLRTVGAIALTLAVLALLRADVSHMVAGSMAAMVATFAVKDKQRREQAVTLALGLPVALTAMSLGALLNTHVIAGDLFFIALIFAAVYSRRFGDRGMALGLIGFQVYFVSLFVRATFSALPGLCGTLAIAFACSAVVRFGLVVETPERILERLRRAFRARLAQLVSAQIELLDAGPARLEKALEDVRLHTARLHETALMIQGRLDEGTSDSATASLVQRRVADAEIAAERLGVLLLSARSAERADTLTLHLPNAPLPAPGDWPRAQDDVTATLRRDLHALRMLVLRPVSHDRGPAVAHLRNRLLGYRDEENLPRASAAVQDVFRGIGEAARSVLGLRLAVDGPQDESDDTPATTRSREELDAEDVAIAGAEEKEPDDDGPTGLKRPTTRSAVQVSVGSALAIVGGEFLSSQRWYWAVLTCWVVFLNTASTGEILVKGYRRLLGTVLGVVAGVALAGLVGNRTWLAFVLVLLFIFAMFYSAPLSYALMSFFVTAMLGLLYTLLNTYSPEVLVLRIAETALGAACGVIAAVLVLPVNTDRRTDELLGTVLSRLGDVTDAAVEQLSGGPALDLLDKARDLDTALDDLRSSTQPLTHPITPLRARRQTARYLVALLETCAYHARSLAATAELLPYSKTVAADPRLKRAGRRIADNIGVLVARVEDEGSEGVVETGASLAAMLEADTEGATRPDRVTSRVLRHLQRLDEGVVGLARPLGVSVSSPDRESSRGRVGS
ncbi:membrane protein [Streptomyces avermitilis]|uniref:Membrane protein n=1 Tax=Streptomyces avermitilis TaxID=33903 RepID=A0A4D4N6Q0_STRAX|nr:membrane protein [Streptomyces avermitilis]GDY60696.1 membrane protein [Streptomyces avermitilis]GDY79225.1 membrane protein [Streptomyces avermitilis]GDY87942.1 membrane protein [Streptomyces avermitilis]